MKRHDQTPRRGKRLPSAIAALLVLAMAAGSIADIPSLPPDAPRFVGLYLDRVLDSLEGRTWLVTNGAMDDALMRRARERGLPLRCLSLADTRSAEALQAIKSLLVSPRLRNAAELGLPALLQEWIASEPGAVRDLALMLVPDFWAAGGYEALPNGLVFLGVAPADAKAVQPRDIIARHQALWREMAEALEQVPNTASAETLYYRDRIVRAQVSFVGNNLGVLLNAQGHTNDAFEVFDRIHAFDADNVSALLNWASMVLDGHAPPKHAAALASLDLLKQRLAGAQLPVWSLSRVYGYVCNPSAFEQLGWSWATSGQPMLALNALKQAAVTATPERRTAIRAQMATINLLRDRPEESERVYVEMLQDDPDNHDALMGLVRLSTQSGDLVRAREYLDRARKAGVPQASLLTATALIARFEGNAAKARAILQEQVDLDPANVTSWAYLCAFLVEERDTAALAVAVAKLEGAAGADSYQAYVARGSQAELLRDPRTARSAFLNALRLQPNAVVLLNHVLRLDFWLADQAAGAKHARELLRLDPEHGFANYVMGSLALAAADTAGAEDYLRRSVKAEPTAANLNDLADLLVQHGRTEEAERHILQAKELDGHNYAVWDTHGLILLAMGKLDEAEAAFRAALELEDDDLRVRLHLAEVLSRRNDTAGASECIRAIARGVDTLSLDDRQRFEALQAKFAGEPVRP